jgi:large subunit ribosomal protein L23
VNLNNIKTMSILDKITKKKDDKKDVKEKEEKKVIDKKTDEKEVKRVIEKKKGKSSGKSVKAKKVSKEKMPIHYFELIKKPHISEKALTFNSVNKYVFVVSRSANKSEIKKAIASLYGVVVKSVNTIKAPSKPKKFKGIPGIKSGYKKAIITLEKGNKIDVMKEKK